jgi:hypothetical protein
MSRFFKIFFLEIGLNFDGHHLQTDPCETINFYEIPIQREINLHFQSITIQILSIHRANNP